MLFISLLFSAICKAPSDSHFAFLHFFFLGMILIHVSCTMLAKAVIQGPFRAHTEQADQPSESSQAPLGIPQPSQIEYRQQVALDLKSLCNQRSALMPLQNFSRMHNQAKRSKIRI